ncbi:hypothetical protein BACCIP111883_04039 [Sutcliffiella rhizosphaerae]|uniref:Uncharacterized protein n=1 Tax=Sutcliffiella rhizosphaerae TaxID=2880967 RepID=A0ABM8YTD3_9BACI|nr:hypothetical protein BACCIP111883_04039 [Sutcliffiella rhizosphaerae]
MIVAGAWSWTIRKAEAPCSAPTSIRRGGEKVGFYLLDDSAYDLEGLGAGARQSEMRKAPVQRRTNFDLSQNLYLLIQQKSI